MSGIVGVVESNSATKNKTLVESMIGTLLHYEDYSVERLFNKSENFICAKVVNCYSGENDSYVYCDEDLIVIIDGFIKDLSFCVDECKVGFGNVAEGLAKLYKANNLEFICDIEGSFSLAIYDKVKNEICLVSDKIGSRPLYYCHVLDRFLFASEVKAILKCDEVEKKLNREAIADFLILGFLLGDKTLVNNVSVLGPATILTYNISSNITSTESYWSLGELFSPKLNRSKESLYEEMEDSFSNSVNGYLRDDCVNMFSLSGGLDSRAVLAAARFDGFDASTYTLGVQGCADQKIANCLASIVNLDHTFLEMNRDYLNDFVNNIKKMVRLTDGMYLTHGVTEIIALKFLESNPSGVLFRGHGGEVAKAGLAWPFCVDERVMSLSGCSQVIEHVLKNNNYVSSHVDYQKLFVSGSYIDVNEVVKSGLDSAVGGVSGEMLPGDLLMYLYINERHRRFTANSLKIFNSRTNVAVPFMDVGFLTSLLKAPLEMRIGTDIHKYIIKKNNTDFMDVVDSNTGAPLTAGDLRLFVMDKFNSVLKKLRFSGFRHYHDFNQWVRESQREHVKNVLLDPLTLERGGYSGEYVEQLIEEHNSAKVDHGYLFEVMMILEFYQREFFD